MNAREVVARASAAADMTNATPHPDKPYPYDYEFADRVFAHLDAEGYFLCRDDSDDEDFPRYVPIPRDDT